MRLTQSFAAFLFTLVVAIANSSPAMAVEYTVTLLPFDFQTVSVNGTDGMNFGGQSRGNERHAILLDDRLENPVNLNPQGYHSSSVENVSGAYQAGWANESGGFFSEHAMLWNGTSESAVDLHPDRFQSSAVLDVSDEHQVGRGTLNNGFSQTALLWNGTAESVVELTPQGFGYSIANAISGDSQVGYAVPNTPTGMPRAVLWRGSAESYVNLHPAGYSSSGAYGVSGNVQVGSGIGPSGQHALMWRGTRQSVVDLHPSGYDDFASYAWDVSGIVQVGSVTRQDPPEYEEYAYAWHGTAESAVNLHSYLEDLGPDFTFSSAFGWTNGHIAVWKPIAVCDFDQDGACTVGDVDALVSEIVAGTHGAVFDLSADGVVNNVDLDRWLDEAANHNGFAVTYLTGDANLDGIVNVTDLNALGINWQQSPNTWTTGDFNADGVVNAIDLNQLGANWLASIPAAANASTVPEPTSAGLLSIGLIVILRKRRLTLA